MPIESTDTAVMSEGTHSAVPSRRAWWAALAALIVAVHGALVLRQFPPRSLRDIPLTSVELSCHLAHSYEGYTCLAQQHRLWGYSPRYMAGYPFGLWNSVGKRGDEIATSVFRWMSFETAFYAWIVTTSFLPVLLVAWAAYLATRSGCTALVCLALTAVVYHLGNIVSYLWTTGMIAFVFASSLAVLYAAFINEAWIRGRWLFAAGAGLALGAIGWFHPFALLPAGLATLAAVGLNRERLKDPGAWLRLVLAGAIAVVVLLPWVAALIEFRDQRIYMSHARLPSGWKYLIMDLFSDRRYRAPFDRRTLLHLVLVTALLGSVWSARRGERGPLVCAWAAVGVFVCAYLFAYSEALVQTQPYRFLVSTELLAIVPASVGLVRLGGLWRQANREGRLAAVCVGLMLVPSLTGYGFDFMYGLRHHARGLGADKRQIVAWLNAQGSRPGRVLCEDDELGNVLPYFTGREVIGSSMVREAPLVQSWPVTAFEQSFGRTNLAAYLDLYNIAFAVAKSPRWTSSLQAPGAGLTPAAQFGAHVILARTGVPASYVWQAPALDRTVVRAEPNHIVIEEAPAGRFVIKYHFLRSLACGDGATLYPQPLLEDPAPFIGIDNFGGLKRIEIVNRP